MADMAEHILLIDDDMRLSAMVADYLRSHGYQVATAAYQAAHQQLCTFNVWYTKTFRAQIRSARQAHSKACPTPS